MLRLGVDDSSLVYTLDVITPNVDDPVVFGRIAAANALSDVYAMGGTPQVALSFVGIPTEVVGEHVVRDVMVGMNEACREAGATIVGGHTMKDAEPKCGLAVIGRVPDDAWMQTGARAGDALVLTKPLGTGLLGQAMQTDRASTAQAAAATASMVMLNRRASELGRAHAGGVHAATDITGFGLLGHLRNVVAGSSVSIRVEADRVPQLPGALAFAEAGVVPGGSRRNLTYAEAVTTFEADVATSLRLVLADAQTSGGLLLFVPEAGADALVAALHADGHPHAARIGRVEAEGVAPAVNVTR